MTVNKMIFENQIECRHVRDSGRVCGGNTFRVYRDKETGKISLICAWNHITTIPKEAEG